MSVLAECIGKKLPDEKYSGIWGKGANTCWHYTVPQASSTFCSVTFDKTLGAVEKRLVNSGLIQVLGLESSLDNVSWVTYHPRVHSG